MDEARFRHFYPGTDPDSLTLERFFGMIDLIPIVMLHEHGGEKADTAVQIWEQKEQTKAELAYRAVFKGVAGE